MARNAITPQQEKFCAKYLECGNASEAFRFAYPKSESWKDTVVWSHASTLLKNGKVQERLKELQRLMQKEEITTLKAEQKRKLRMRGCTITDYIKNFGKGDGSVEWKPLDEWTPEMKASCKNIKTNSYGQMVGVELYSEAETTDKVWETLGFNKQIDVNLKTSDGDGGMTDEELDASIERLLKARRKNEQG